MVALKGLEDWAREILEVPTPVLNRHFGSPRYEDGADLIRKSIESLPFFSRYRPVFRALSAPTLRELHRKLRGQKCETNFWIALLGILDHPMPDEVAFDLIERKIAISWLGHSPQSDEVLWCLTALVDEAILTLASRFYTDKNRSLEGFEDILNKFLNHEWMLESLAHCSAVSLEKRRAYEKSIENHPKRERWLGTNPKIEPEQTPFRYFDWSRLPDSERMKMLYGVYDSQRILDIARDDGTPDEILRELEELRGFSNAAKVRAAARHTLRRREEASNGAL